MRELRIKVYFFDPIGKTQYEVFDDVMVDIVKVQLSPYEVRPLYSEPVVLKPLANERVFRLDASHYSFSHHHFVRVGFTKLNFSPRAKKLLSPNEVTSDVLPLYHPCRLPYWDSGFDEYYRINKYFSFGYLDGSSTGKPLEVKIPIRRLYNIGHRGAPYREPENTIDSFRKALELGANGLELDLCLAKENKVIVFHDTKPLDLLSPIDRASLEHLPFPIVSPEFITVENQRIAVLKNGKEQKIGEKKIVSGDEFDIANLTVKEVRKYYRYKSANGSEHTIPELEDFLRFAEQVVGLGRNELALVYLDIKTPDFKKQEKCERLIQYGKLIGEAIKRHQNLPKMIVGNPDNENLKFIRDGIEQANEKRCDFAYDAQGNLNAWLESIPSDLMKEWIAGFMHMKLGSIVIGVLCWCLRRLSTFLCRNYDPVKVTKAMKNSAVSVGNFARPRSFEEIKSLIRTRDLCPGSKLKTIIYYTLNDPQSIYQSIGIGVNGVVSDRPEAVKEWLEEKGIVIS